LLDRVDVHAVLEEMRIARNTIIVDHFAKSSSSSSSSFRAVWTSTPTNGSSKLFHRWLVRGDHSQPETKQTGGTTDCVEHLNDIPLDCRRANLCRAPNRIHNNVWTHRLVRAFRAGNGDNALRDMEAARVRYTGVLRDVPPLPDCVFAQKRMREEPVREREAPKQALPKRVRAATSNS
jgi:hypothetical protein